MPHSEHRRKSHRKAMQAQQVNRARRSAAKKAMKKARTAVETAAADTGASVKTALKAIDKAASYGVFHRNKAARLKSRLAKAANAAAKS